MVQIKAILISALLVAMATAHFHGLNKELDESWDEFKAAHGKHYSPNGEEIARRLIWEQNLRSIQKHNLEYDLGMHTYTQGMNQFTDLTAEEYRQLLRPMNISRKSDVTIFMAPLNLKDLPTDVDWRDHGYVTPVKNQAQCGSCWAFSTTGSLEGQHFRKTGQLVSLSEQQLVDCSGNFGNNGCGGGLMDNAFRYIAANKGIDTESCYPYEARDDTCRYKTSCIGATDTGYVDVASQDENALKSAVATIGPISVAIDASHPSFQSYRDGVYNEPQCSATQLDHGVLAVGYGTDNGQDYWLVKNSWGNGWGTGGYIKMSRNSNNQCGIATMASYPTV